MDNAALVDILAWLIGGVIVTVFSWNFYNQESYYLDQQNKNKNNESAPLTFLAPVLPRYAASKTLYIGWFLAFLAFTVSLYILTALFLEKPETNTEELIDSINGAGTFSILFMAYNQLLAAFIVTGINNVVPRRLDILTQLRKLAHRQAKIPEEARAVYKRISSADLRLTEQQKNNAIAYAGEDVLYMSDFDVKPGAIERSWSAICHLLAEASQLSKDTLSIYGTNIHNEKLQYDAITQTFERLKNEIIARRHKKNFTKDKLLSDQLSYFLKQVTHMVVCLVFLSEPSRAKVYSRWHDIGVVLRIRPRFKINTPSMFTAMAAFSAVVTVVSFLLGMITTAPADGDVVDFAYAKNTAMGTLLVVCMPMIFPMVVKWLLSDYWPVRGQFSHTRQPAIYVAFFIVGSILGMLGLYLTSLMGFMNEHWSFYRPYVMLSGAAAGFMAWSIDRRARIVSQEELFFRSTPLATAGLIVFFVIGVVAVIWSEQIAARQLEITALLKEEAFLFLLISVIGAMVGATASILSDVCLRLKTDREEIGLNLSEYLLPVVGFKDFEDMPKEEIDHIISTNLDDLPEDFVEYLEEKNIVRDKRLTEFGYEVIMARDLMLAISSVGAK